ncbi:MAG: DNA repair protein RecN, partial [Eggerthellaceae bacterium]|nr:DNA repair protein RecN [Eggerthellaceae bacterium]
IEQASIEFSPKLTVITGETGAGKSALLSALGLLMGARADKMAVREGEDKLSVAGRFFGLLAPDADDASDETIITRSVTSDGRSKATIDGMMASVGELASRVAPSIDLCSQHEHQQLMRPATHLKMLDAWCGENISDAKAAYEAAFDTFKEAQAELDRVNAASAADLAQLDDARLVLRRIDAVNPKEGEYEQLIDKLARAEHAESLALAAQTAHDALSGDGGAIDALEVAVSALSGVSRIDASLEPYVASLREAGYLLEDAAGEVRDYRESVEFDPDELERMQERVSAMQGLLKAYGPRMQDVLSAREAAAHLVEAVDDTDFARERAQKAANLAKTELERAADALARLRKEAAPLLSDEVNAYMQRLEMGSASIECAVFDLEFESWTRTGSQAVEFLFKPGSSLQARPLQRIASGGEISRVMLSIKAVLGEADEVDTLIFDEIDAGVAGSAARALGEVLSDLAKTHQVIAVTHLAQVAVHGNAHYVVQKTDEAYPRTFIEEIYGDVRVDEIARMLSGEVTDVSRAHAEELMAQASVYAS